MGKVIFEGDVETAIGIYSGSGRSELPLIYELNDTPRPSGQHGHDVRITKFEFLGDRQAIFNRTAGIDFEITFEARKNIEDLKLYFILNSSNGTAIGMAQTIEPIVNTVSEETYCCRFHFDCSNMAEDTYNFTPDLFSDDGNGKHWSVDHPLCNVVFKLVENSQEGLDWDLRTYGSVRLNPIAVINKGV